MYTVYRSERENFDMRAKPAVKITARIPLEKAREFILGMALDDGEVSEDQMMVKFYRDNKEIIYRIKEE